MLDSEYEVIKLLFLKEKGTICICDCWKVDKKGKRKMLL